MVILVENHDFFMPLAFDAPLRGSLSDYCHTVWYVKTEWCGYSMVENVWRYVLPFRQNTGVWQTNGQTDSLRRHSPRYKTSDIRPISCFISEIIQDIAICTMTDQQKVVVELSHFQWPGTIPNRFQGHAILYSLTLTISQTAKDTAIVAAKCE